MEQELKKALIDLGLVKDISEIKSMCRETNKKLDDTNEKLDKAVIEVDLLKAENEQIKGELRQVKSKNVELQLRIEELDQYGRKNDVIVRNIPEAEEENLKKIITSAAEKLNVSIREWDIVVVHRLPTKSGIKPIIARFLCYDKKRELLKAFKTMKPNGIAIGIDTTLPIYMDDHLSKETRALWNDVRDMVDEGYFYSAKCFDGTIKVKQKQEEPATVLKGKNLLAYREWRQDTQKANKKRNMDVRSPDGVQHGINRSKQMKEATTENRVAEPDATNIQVMDSNKITGGRLDNFREKLKKYYNTEK